MKKIEQTFNNSNIGGVTGDGTVEVGGMVVSNTGVSADVIADVVMKLMAFAQNIDDPTVSQQGKAIASELQEKPSQGTIEKAIGWVKLVASGAQAGSELYDAGSGLLESLGKLAG